MKKVMAIISILMIVAMMCSAFAGSDNQITFRGVEWYSTLAEVKDVLDWKGYEIAGDDLIAMCDIDYNWDYSFSDNDNKIDCIGFCLYYNGDLDVAGYNCWAYLSFIYPIENDSSVKNEDEAQLYMAKYTTDGYSDYQSVYNDLKTKLTGLYGEGENRDIRYSNECTYWVDSEGNELVLSMGSLNSVEISYAASGHRERLKQMHDIRLSEIYLAESAERAQKANDTSGL